MQMPLPVQNKSQLDYSRLFDTKRSFRLLEISPSLTLDLTQATGRWYRSGLDFPKKRYTLQWSTTMACTESVRCAIATLLGGFTC
jgi:hypothetical protein